MISHKSRTRSDKIKTKFEQVACRIYWTAKGPQNGGPLYITPCATCNKPGRIRTIGEINRDNKKGTKSYCSNKCSRSIILNCKTCGKECYQGMKNGKRGKFCSKACYAKWQKSDENKGVNNPNWREDAVHEPDNQRTRKSDEWKIWRKRVYERDSYSCKFCTSNKKLEPHHIIPRRRRPDLIFEVSNGITLCKQCHSKTIGKEHLFENECFSRIIEAGYFHK